MTHDCVASCGLKNTSLVQRFSQNLSPASLHTRGGKIPPTEGKRFHYWTALIVRKSFFLLSRNNAPTDFPLGPSGLSSLLHFMVSLSSPAPTHVPTWVHRATLWALIFTHHHLWLPLFAFMGTRVTEANPTTQWLKSSAPETGKFVGTGWVSEARGVGEGGDSDIRDPDATDGSSKCPPPSHAATCGASCPSSTPGCPIMPAASGELASLTAGGQGQVAAQN